MEIALEPNAIHDQQRAIQRNVSIAKKGKWDTFWAVVQKQGQGVAHRRSTDRADAPNADFGTIKGQRSTNPRQGTETGSDAVLRQNRLPPRQRSTNPRQGTETLLMTSSRGCVAFCQRSTNPRQGTETRNHRRKCLFQLIVRGVRIPARGLKRVGRTCRDRYGPASQRSTNPRQGTETLAYSPSRSVGRPKSEEYESPPGD